MMARPRLDAHLVIVAETVARYATTLNLLGIDYTHRVPQSVEFPTRIPKLDVFVRFFCGDVTPEPIAVEVWHLNVDGSVRERVHLRVQEIGFAPDQSVQDFTIRLANIDVRSEGVYEVRVCRLARSRLQGVYWRRLRSDYFDVKRSRP
jgi:hypothetical protein